VAVRAYAKSSRSPDKLAFGAQKDYNQILMAAKETYVRARVDVDLKQESEAILERLGLTTAEAIRLLLSQIRLRKALPFKIELPPDDDDLLLPPRMRQSALDSVYDD
jgi:addiction module RelB/DinJ family antitoxin